MQEPGLDRHEWESRWAVLEEEAEEAPAEALPEIDRLLEEMLTARGYVLDDPVIREGEDREVVAEFLAAREVTRLADEGSEDISPGDIASAFNDYRSLHEYLIEQRSPP